MPTASSAPRVLRLDSSAPLSRFFNPTLPPVSLMFNLLLGTRNAGKVKEITSILGDSGWTFSSLQEFEKVASAEENGNTYAENAIGKAQFYASATGLFDSGRRLGFGSGGIRRRTRRFLSALRR